MTFKQLLGLLLGLFGALAIVGLVFFYSAVLFTTRWSVLDPWHDAFHLLFGTPSGIVVIYAVFLILFIPLFFCTVLGLWLLFQKAYISKKLSVLLLFLWLLALIFGSVLFVNQTRHMIDRVKPFSEDPVTFDVSTSIPLSVQQAFGSALKSEVNRTLGVPKEGYEPYMFLEVFPGLSETDFNGAPASIGRYQMVQGKLTHMLDETRLVHTAAKALTDRGFATLLANVSLRLNIDLTNEGTLTEVMEALTRVPENVATSPTQE